MPYIISCLLSIPMLTVTIILVLKKLRYNRELAEKIIYIGCCFMLTYKILQFTMYGTCLGRDLVRMIPVEISAISYFLFPIVYLTNCKPLKDGATFIAFLAGFIQMIAICVSPNSFYGPDAEMSYFAFLESFVMHYMLFAMSFIHFTSVYKLQFKNIWKALSVFVVMIAYGCLASYTFRYDHVNNKPENIMFMHENVLPPFLTIPGLDEGHKFLIVYIPVFVLFVCGYYLIGSKLFTKTPQEPSIWSQGFIRKALIAQQKGNS